MQNLPLDILVPPVMMVSSWEDIPRRGTHIESRWGGVLTMHYCVVSICLFKGCFKRGVVEETKLDQQRQVRLTEFERQLGGSSQ